MTGAGFERLENIKRLALLLAGAILLALALGLVLTTGPAGAAPGDPCVDCGGETNTPPTVTVSSTLYNVGEGGSVTLSGTYEDLDGDTVTVTVDTDNNLTYESDATGDGLSSGTWSYIFSAGERDGPGDYKVNIKASDSGGFGTASTTVKVANAAPTAFHNAPSSVNEGDFFTVSMTNPYDPSKADRDAGFAYAFDCGHGNGYRPYSSSSSDTCSVQDKDGPGSQTVRAKIKDKDGGEREYSRTVTINNVAPTASFNAPQTSYAGKSFVVSMTNPSDPSRADRDAGFTYAFNCGNAYGSFGNSSVASCQAGSAGTPQTVKAKIKDKDGGEREYSRPLNVTAAPPSYPNGKIAFWSNRDGDDEVYVMNADGSGQTNITNNAAKDGGFESCDGCLAFSRPAFSPNGERIAFASGREHYAGDIYSMNANGTGVSGLTNDPYPDGAPAYSPDGSMIAFASDREGGPSIYVMNAADGSGQIRLIGYVSSNHKNDAPAYSPNGSQIAFVSNRDGSEEIYVMNAADGSGQTRLTNNAAVDGDPVFSPDGSKIAFWSDRGGSTEIYVMNADGSGQTRLTDNAVYDLHPNFSPDGSKIVFFRRGEIYVMNADGTNQNPLTTMQGQAFDGFPNWGGAGDTAPPETTLDASGPSGTVNNTSGEFRFSSEPDVVFQCRLSTQSGYTGSHGFQGCTSPKTYGNLTEGRYTFEVRAVDKAANVDPTPASRTWTVDLTGPAGTVTINGGAADTNNTSVNFALSASDPPPNSGVADMRFSGDGTTWSAWEPYASSKSWTLTSGDGQKTVHVQYRDGLGNVGRAAQDSITLDTTAPAVTGVSPTDGAQGVAEGANLTATFSEGMTDSTLTNQTFTLLKQGSGATVQAAVVYDAATNTATLNPDADLDSSASYAATVKGGSSGAKDKAGNPLATDKTWSFSTSDTRAPNVSLTAPDDGATVGGLIRLSAEATDNVAVDRVEFLVNGASVGVPDSSAPYERSWDSTSISGDTVRITARAVDTSNNAATSAAHTVTVDNVAPETTLDSGPSGTVTSTSASFSFSSPESGATFECKLDAQAFAACNSPKAYMGLSDDTHTFSVRARDAAGNVDASPAGRTWTIDATAPTIKSWTPKGTGIKPTAKPTVVFSEKMDESSVLPTTFFLKKGTTKVAATVSYVEAETATGAKVYKAVLVPSKRLRSGAKYTATVTTAATDAAGNGLDQNPSLAGNQPKTWRFTVK